MCKESDKAYLLGVPPRACFEKQVTPHLRLYTQTKVPRSESSVRGSKPRTSVTGLYHLELAL